MKSNKVQVILVDDNPTFLEGLDSMFIGNEDYEIIGKFNSGKELLEDKALNYVDMILLDIEMPGINGIQAAKRINFIDPKVKLVAITMYQDKLYLNTLIEAGFKGFVNKQKVSEKLFEVLDAVRSNKFSFSEDLDIH